MERGPIEERMPPTVRDADAWERELRELLAAMDRAVGAVIVEGPNDEAALRAAGITAPIYQCSTATGLYAMSAAITESPIVILTDYDDAGRSLNGRLRKLLPEADVAPNWRRDFGLLLTQKGRYDVESLNNVFDRGL